MELTIEERKLNNLDKGSNEDITILIDDDMDKSNIYFSNGNKNCGKTLDGM
jgi:hypothetical protein